jgi:hypothetical protein
MTRYAKFDPTSEELVLDKDITVTNLNYECKYWAYMYQINNINLLDPF